MKKYLRVAGVVVVLAIIGWKWWGADRSTGADVPPVVASTIPAGAEGFDLGRLRFEPCELQRPGSSATTAAFCAPFQVPENRADPQARMLDMRVALLKANSTASDDPVVYLAGGPGQSAIDTWPSVAPAMASLRRHRHVLLMDQRGTGGSHALRCEALASMDETLTPSIDTVRQLTAACLEEVSRFADPRHYSTTDAVADLEDLRQAIGAPLFNLVGISYGTRVAQQYMNRHPQALRSVVLDSPVPNTHTLGEAQAVNLDNALKAQFAVCTAEPACAQAFGDPYATLIRLRDALNAQPRTVSWPDPHDFGHEEQQLDGGGVATLARFYAYAPETAALLPLVLHEAAAGRFAPLMGQLDVIMAGMEELAGSGMPLSVICTEDADHIVPDPRDADTVMGTLMNEIIAVQCALWPRGEVPDDFNTAVSGNLPVLVLAGEFDPVTPPRFGEEIVAGLDNALLIVAAGQSHAVSGRGCLPKLVGRFVDTLEPGELDLSCTELFGATPAFIDYNGAAP